MSQLSVDKQCATALRGYILAGIQVKKVNPSLQRDGFTFLRSQRR